jgi:hypothetical protein
MNAFRGFLHVSLTRLLVGRLQGLLESLLVKEEEQERQVGGWQGARYE